MVRRSLVSVIVPVHNGADYLRAALESILAPGAPPLEVVVVDDASTDRSGEIALGLGDPRVRVVRQERRGGVAAALNRGLAETRGSLVARMDADDVALPGRIAAQAAWLERHPDVAVVGGGVRYIDEQGRRLRGRWGLGRRRTRNPRRSLLRLVNPLVHPTVMYRRAVVEQAGGYDAGYEGAEDFELWLRVTRTHAVTSRPEPVLLLRKHEENYSGAERTAVTTLAAVLRERAIRMGAEEGGELREAAFRVARWFFESDLRERRRRRHAALGRLRAFRPPSPGDLVALIRYRLAGNGVRERELRRLATECLREWLAATGVPVSVVIPFYDGTETIGRALDSLARQSVLPREVVVVDDGSPDRFEADDGVRPFRVRTLRHEKNRGIPAARNTGIRAAAQPWVAFLDQDDEWLPEKLERQWRAVLAAENPRETVFFGRCRVEGGLHRPWSYPGFRIRRRLERGGEDALAALVTGDNQVALQTVLVARKLLERHGHLDESLRGGSDDYELVLRLAAEGCRFRCCDPPGTVGALRYLTERSYSHAPRFFRDNMAIVEKLRDRYGLTRRLLLRLEARSHFRLARHHVREGRVEDARSAYRAAARARPLWWKPYAGLLLIKVRGQPRPRTRPFSR